MKSVAELKLAAVTWLRRLRRTALVAIRRPFRTDEDFVRDSLMDGLRRDLQATTIALSQSAKVIGALNERLEYYEERFPRLRMLRAQYNAEKQKEKHTADEQVRIAVAAHEAEADRLAVGLLR